MAGIQTWWGFPTWRETLSPFWNDPTVQVNTIAASASPLGLAYHAGATRPWPTRYAVAPADDGARTAATRSRYNDELLDNHPTASSR